MKKVLFGSAAAILAVVGLSSFKAHHRLSQATYYYWLVATGDGSISVFHNVNLSTYYETLQPSSSPCASGSAFKRVVGFASSQVTGVGNNTTLKRTVLEGQTPMVVPFKRPEE
jgi:hypothetical protein